MQVENQGTVWVFTMESAEERAWVLDRVHIEGWQWQNPSSFVVDARCGAELAIGMMSEGILEEQALAN